MIAGNAIADISPLSSSRRNGGKRMDKWLALSLCASILLHGFAWLAYRYCSGRPQRHVFILLNSGDHAMEMTLGGAASMPSSQASPKEEIQEQRFAPDLPLKTPLEKASSALTPEPKQELSPALALPDRARLPVDASGIFNKPRERNVQKTQRKKTDSTVSPSPPPALPSSAPASGSGVGNSASPGVRQRAKPSGSGFTLLYPESARQSGETGTVAIEASISADGVCRSAVVTRPSPYPSLNEAALAAILAASYHPAHQNGIPIASKEIFEIAFELSD